MEVLQSNTAPAVEGVSAQKVESQANETTEQSASQTQETTQPNVEGSESGQEVKEETRKASDFYKERNRYRKKVEALEQKLASFEVMLSKQNQSVPSATKNEVTNDDFYKNGPVETVKKLMADLREELRSEIPNILQNTQKEAEFRNSDKEATALIEKEKISMEDFIKFMDENALLDGYMKNPVKIAQTALKMWKLEKPVTNPNAPKKAHMVSTATGSMPNKGGSATDAISKITEMKNRLAKDNSLRYDPKFQAELSELTSQFK